MTGQSSDRIILDTYAWIEYFRGASEVAKKFIEGRYELLTPTIVLAELSDKYRREGNSQWEFRRRFIKLRSRVIFLDDRTADRAGDLKMDLRKHYNDASLADAIILAHCVQTNSKILTGDKHFKHVKNAILLD